MKKKTLAKRLKREHVINKAQGRVIHRMTLQISQLTVMVEQLESRMAERDAKDSARFAWLEHRTPYVVNETASKLGWPIWRRQ